jgi:LuxR family maltose regulon positive regulatory protein
MAAIRVALGSGDHAAARSAISALGQDIRTSGRGTSAIRLRILEAMLAWNEGDRPAAAALLRAAIAAAHVENLVRVFVDEGPGTARILNDLLPTLIPSLDTSVAAFANSVLGAIIVPPACEQGIVLSPREYEILRELNRDKSNKLIARELGLSERTVKFHLGNLYLKLGVCHRSAAVGAARELGLLS